MEVMEAMEVGEVMATDRMVVTVTAVIDTAATGMTDLAAVLVHTVVTEVTTIHLPLPETRPPQHLVVLAAPQRGLMIMLPNMRNTMVDRIPTRRMAVMRRK